MIPHLCHQLSPIDHPIRPNPSRLRKLFGPILKGETAVFSTMVPLMSKAWSGQSLDEGLALLSAVRSDHQSAELPSDMGDELTVPC